MDPRLLKPQAPDFMGPPEPIAPLAPIAAPMPEAPSAPPVADTPAQPKAPDFDFSKLMVTPEDLQQRAETKRRNALMGGVGQSMSNLSSFGHAFLGRQPQKHDFSDTTKALDEYADAPIEGKQALLKQELQKPELEYMKQAIDPKSETSARARELARVQLGMFQRSIGKNNPQLSASLGTLSQKLDGMSQYEMEKAMLPIVKVMGDQGLQLSKAELTAMLAGRRLEQADRGLGIRETEQANAAVDRFDKDEIIKNYTKRLEQIKLDKHTIESGGVISSEVADEISMGIANALSGGSGAGFHMVDMNRLKSAQRTWGDIKSYVTGKKFEALTPEQKNFMAELLDRLEGGYERAMDRRAQTLRQGRSYPNNPQAQQALDQKAGSYGPKALPVGGTDANAGSGKVERPPVGYVMDGHTYIGGDPSKAESWEVQK